MRAAESIKIRAMLCVFGSLNAIKKNMEWGAANKNVKIPSLGKKERRDLNHSPKRCMRFKVAVLMADLKLVCVLPLCRSSAASPS